jgi:hypothetical protein
VIEEDAKKNNYARTERLHFGESLQPGIKTETGSPSNKTKLATTSFSPLGKKKITFNNYSQSPNARDKKGNASPIKSPDKKVK